MTSFAKCPTVDITSQFWRNYRNLVVDKVLPYQWAVMDDAAEFTVPDDPSGNTFEQSKSYAVRNIKVAAGLEKGEHYGFPFQDSDLYKWLEAAAYTLNYRENPELKATADALVDLLAQAQEPDGYLDTMFMRGGQPENRFKLLQRSHELYTMGHYIEAGVAYYQVTGNQKALDIARGMADCIYNNFGADEGKIHGVDGHPEIEIALPRLYKVTGDARYLDLASYFIHRRGQDPDFFRRQNAKVPGSEKFLEVMNGFPDSYYQMDKPFVEQTTAEGHAVRVTYLCVGAAEVAALTGDQALTAAVERLWNDIVRKRMYITGQIGSTHVGESFTYDYDLPNDAMYGESCASVSMSFFARRMMELQPRGEYGDVLEKELFNGAISGMSLDGTHFYYVNPLEADPEGSAKNPDRRHVLTHRADWFGCACCPANIARLVASVDRYIYTVHGDTIYSHQFIANKADFGHGVRVEQTNNFPWDGDVHYRIENREGSAFRFAVRIPSWSAASFAVEVNGEPLAIDAQDGFVTVDVAADQSEVELTVKLDMSVKAMVASTRVREDTGKVAFMRGPVVFCAEGVDNPEALWRYHVSSPGAAARDAEAKFEPDLLGGVETLTVTAELQEATPDGAELYVPVDDEPSHVEAKLKLVPYYSWANRENGQMSVWLSR